MPDLGILNAEILPQRSLLMNVPQLPYGLTIHQVKSRQDKKELCLFLILNSGIRELLTGSFFFYSFFYCLLALGLSSLFASRDISVEFKQFLAEPLVWLNPSLNHFMWGLYIVVLLRVTITIISPLFVLTDKSGSYYFVKRNQKIVAYVCIFNGLDSMTLSSIYIIPRYRRKGIGSALIRYFLLLHAIPIHVFFWKPSVLRFYTQLGFELQQDHKLSKGVLILKPSQA